MPTASGVPKRATSNGSGPERMRAVARSFIVISRALEAGHRDFALFSGQRAGEDEALSDRIVVTAGPFLRRGVRLVMASDACHQKLADPLAHERGQHHQYVAGI